MTDQIMGRFQVTDEQLRFLADFVDKQGESLLMENTNAGGDDLLRQYLLLMLNGMPEGKQGGLELWRQVWPEWVREIRKKKRERLPTDDNLSEVEALVLILTDLDDPDEMLQEQAGLSADELQDQLARNPVDNMIAPPPFVWRDEAPRTPPRNRREHLQRRHVEFSDILTKINQQLDSIAAEDIDSRGLYIASRDLIQHYCTEIEAELSVLDAQQD